VIKRINSTASFSLVTSFGKKKDIHEFIAMSLIVIYIVKYIEYNLKEN